MEAKMSRKVDEILEELRNKGFDMTTKEFIETTVYKILNKYHIHEKVTENDYFELLRKLMDLCAENDMNNMGFSYEDYDDWKDE